MGCCSLPPGAGKLGQRRLKSLRKNQSGRPCLLAAPSCFPTFPHGSPAPTGPGISFAALLSYGTPLQITRVSRSQPCMENGALSLRLRIACVTKGPAALNKPAPRHRLWPVMTEIADNARKVQSRVLAAPTSRFPHSSNYQSRQASFDLIDVQATAGAKSSKFKT